MKEIGANTIRLGHYPFDRYTLESVDRLGLIAWAELPVGIGVTTEVDISITKPSQSVCPRRDPSPAFVENARQQLQEMIRQQYNHASITVWSLGNETTFMHKDCREPWHDNLTPLFRELHSLAKQEDPSRATTYADFTATVTPPVNGSYIELGGITDVWARNEYPLWYGGAPTGDVLDALRKRYPACQSAWNFDPRSASKIGSDSHLMILHGGVALVSEENQRHGEQLAFVFLDPCRIDRRRYYRERDRPGGFCSLEGQ